MLGERMWTKRYIQEVREKLQKKTATKMMLQDVMIDINNHLAMPCGTISNYSGVFGQAAVKAIVENYPEYIDEDAVKASEEIKVQAIINQIIISFNKNKKIFIPPQHIKLVLDFIRKRDSEVDKDKDKRQPQFIVVGYSEAKGGKEVKPLPKS